MLNHSTATPIDRKAIITTGGILFALVFISAFLSLRLWRIDFNVPFNYWGDTNWFLVPIKGILQNGWAYHVPQLSAPFGLSAVAFPSMSNLDWILVKILGLFTHSAGATLNAFWLLSILFTAWSAACAMHVLGLQRHIYLPLAILYAFLPFTFMRNVAHISLIFYSVPLICLYALHLASGDKHGSSRLVTLLGYLGIVTQAFNYIYFSFFAVVLLMFAGVRGASRTRSWRPLQSAILASTIAGALSLVNLVPSFQSWHEEGKPPNMAYKSAKEAEVFGLKIRKMLAPSQNNPLPVFEHWAEREKKAQFPLENENITARLGFMAGAGFMLMLLVSGGIVDNRKKPQHPALQDVAALGLFSLLVCTIGGFGSLFNLMLPDFRAYNRFSVFIAFFSLASAGIWLQAIIQDQTDRLKKFALLFTFFAFAAFSLYDQALDANGLSERRALDEKAANEEQQIVALLEHSLAPESLVFQLPMTAFPHDAGKELMGPYDHVRPFLWSNRLHWSWPSFSFQHQNWARKLEALEGTALLEALVYSGFSAIWVDRFAYKDRANAISEQLISNGATLIPQAISDRYTLFNLTEFSNKLKKEQDSKTFSKRQHEWLHAPILEWDEYVSRTNYNSKGEAYNWSQAQSSLKIFNPSQKNWTGHLSLEITSFNAGQVSIQGNDVRQTVHTSKIPSPISIPLRLTPGNRISIKFTGNMARYQRNKDDTRPLYFSFSKVRLIEADSTSE